MIAKRQCRREYAAQYRAARVAAAMQFLGGECKVCGSIDDLQFDHIDPSTKVANVTALANKSQAAMDAEVLKCQLLCRAHHAKKTAAERMSAHGTKNRYLAHGCRCRPCTDANARHVAKWRESKRQREPLISGSSAW